MPRAARPLAPPNIQEWDSSLKVCRATWILGAKPSNTQEFLCFQRIHAPSMTRELKPFRCSFGTFLQDFFHHSAKEIVRRVGTKADKFKGCRMLNQNCCVNTQEVRMCWAVSSSWSQRGQCAGCGSPLFCRQSAVQQRLRIASQTKILHFLGTQVFHNHFCRKVGCV